MRKLQIGDIVKCTTDILGNPKGTWGLVYEKYDRGDDSTGVSVIFENGEYDGFSEQEQTLYLERVSRESSLSKYQFKSVIKLSEDYEKGVFDVVFE